MAIILRVWYEIHFTKIVAWALAVKLLSAECLRISQMKLTLVQICLGAVNQVEAVFLWCKSNLLFDNLKNAAEDTKKAKCIAVTATNFSHDQTVNHSHTITYLLVRRLQVEVSYILCLQLVSEATIFDKNGSQNPYLLTVVVISYNYVFTEDWL